MPPRPKVTANKAPRASGTKPKPTKPAPSKQPAKQPPSRATQGSGFGASLLNAGVQLGTAGIAARAAQDTLDKLTQNPMLLAAVAGVALVVLLH
jgi:hypothetical protein